MRTIIELEAPAGVMDVIDFVFRPICLVCREPTGDRISVSPGYQGNLVCSRCIDEIEELEEPTCSRCGTPASRKKKVGECGMCERLPAGMDHMRSSSTMHGVGGQLIHLFKYDGWKALAVPLALKMASSSWFDSEFWDADLLIPVPVSKVRKRERGYNQSALLAEELSGLVGIPVGEGLLHRCSWNRPQVGLPHRERVSNVKNAFQVSERGLDRISGSSVILVDDVITTGATIGACCEALSSAGAGRISSVSFGRAYNVADY